VCCRPFSHNHSFFSLVQLLLVDSLSSVSSVTKANGKMGWGGGGVVAGSLEILLWSATPGRGVTTGAVGGHQLLLDHVEVQLFFSKL
jgi:hypothetical protein